MPANPVVEFGPMNALGVTRDGELAVRRGKVFGLDGAPLDFPDGLTNSGGAEFSVAAYKGLPAIDDTVAFQAAVNAVAALGGGKLAVPYRPAGYTLSSYVNMPSNVAIVGVGWPTVRMSGTARAFRFDNVSRCRVEGLQIDGNKTGVSNGNIITINNCSDIVIRNNRFVNQKGSLALTGASVDCTIQGNHFTDSGSTSIELQGAGVSRNNVLHNKIHNGVGFGVWVAGGANRNCIDGNTTILNGIELVGVTYDSWGNEIVGNHAEGCGDNGISITGFKNSCTGNVCILNAYEGIYLYGSQNAVSGNICVNNGQTSAAQRSGISIGAASGGLGQLNVISGNFIDDDQAVPTQYYGIKVNASLYSLWAATTAYVVGDYRRTSGNNLYRCTVAGTSGAVAPSHTTGTATDGTVTWLYIGTFAGGTSEPYGNTIVGNNVVRSASATLYFDGTTNKSNCIFTNGEFRLYGGGGDMVLGAGFVSRRATAWAAAQTLVYGDIRYNGNNVYRVSNAGGTTANAPVHGAGIVTGGDGIAWQYVRGNGQEYPVFQAVAGGGVQIMGSLQIQSHDAPTDFAKVYRGAGSPEGVVTATPGSLFLRRDGGAGSSFYVKETGTGATGWVAK